MHPHRRIVQKSSASEFGRALGGLNEEEVRQPERTGAVFSVQMSGRQRGREYPAFQSWSGIAGRPLAAVIEVLKELGGAAAYAFFSARNRDLADLTPVELLWGATTRSRQLSAQASDLLKLSADERLDITLAAAQVFHAESNA